MTHATAAMKTMRVVAFATFTALTCAAQAQAPANTLPAAPNQQPTAIGVTPSTGADANQKAVPRSDTGTVVRTGPTAGDRAKEAGTAAADATRSAASSAARATRNAADNVGNATRPAVRNTDNAAGDASGTAGMAGTTGTTGNTRRARSDRN